jgi:hypothetical protein
MALRIIDGIQESHDTVETGKTASDTISCRRCRQSRKDPSRNRSQFIKSLGA